MERAIHESRIVHIVISTGEGEGTYKHIYTRGAKGYEQRGGQYVYVIIYIYHNLYIYQEKRTEYINHTPREEEKKAR